MMSTYTGNSPSTISSNASPLNGVQKVVVVNSSPEILTLAERALSEGHYDVVFVELIEHAYSQIRRVQPNLVVLCLRMADREAFQLLSMLKLDPETRRIPVLTFTAEDAAPSLQEEREEESAHGFFAPCGPTVMN